MATAITSHITSRPDEHAQPYYPHRGTHTAESSSARACRHDNPRDRGPSGLVALHSCIPYISSTAGGHAPVGTIESSSRMLPARAISRHVKVRDPTSQIIIDSLSIYVHAPFPLHPRPPTSHYIHSSVHPSRRISSSPSPRLARDDGRASLARSSPHPTLHLHLHRTSGDRRSRLPTRKRHSETGSDDDDEEEEAERRGGVHEYIVAMHGG